MKVSIVDEIYENSDIVILCVIYLVTYLSVMC